MRMFVATLLLGGLLIASVGCQNGSNPFQPKGKAQPAAQTPPEQPAPEAPADPDRSAEPADPAAPPMPTASKPDFQGHHLNVTLDGQPTAPVESGQVEQIWTVSEPISATPSVLMTFDEAALGPMQKASIIINPIVNGEVQQADLWQYAGRTPIEPGQPIELSVFHHIAGGKIEQNVKGLPPGEYRISVQVNGQKTWDRQHIRATVK